MRIIRAMPMAFGVTGGRNRSIVRRASLPSLPASICEKPAQYEVEIVHALPNTYWPWEIDSSGQLDKSRPANLRWNSHVDSICCKSSQRLFLLRKLKHFHISSEDLVTVYVSYIRPVLEYAAPVWHSGLTTELSNKIEKIQRRAVRIIMGTKYTSYTEGCSYLGLPTLQSRRLLLTVNFANSLRQSEQFRHFLPPVTERQLCEILKALPQTKTTGYDNIDNTLLRLCADHIARPLCHIVNCSLRQGLFPSQWKKAKVIPLIKNKSAPLNGPNSRPISLLPAISKVVERIVQKQIQGYLLFNNIISDCQHAYKKHHSTSSALIEMTDHWLAEVDKGNMVAAVLLDFSAAFDIVDHDILLAKLEGYGFNTLAVSWISSYLRDREQAVFINGDFSTYNKTKCGVPQGSCLGPLLFCLYTNDLATITEKASLVMYADDTTPFVAAPSVAEIKQVLQPELTRIWRWVETNRLVLNVGKTKSILIGSHHKLKQNLN
ncbi:hypothetical protein Bbelb_037540 [Branchiostoma belcheri]|nr:hypothetical protein Bbelb_037540 [Branchiostoma belcheri]